MSAAGAMRQTGVRWAAGWRRGAALVEQGAVAGANFVAFVLFARALEPAAWGEFGFAYALLLFLQGFQRALVTIPMVTFSARAADGGWEAGRRAWVRGNTSLALLCAVALVWVTQLGAPTSPAHAAASSAATPSTACPEAGWASRAGSGPGAMTISTPSGRRVPRWTNIPGCTKQGTGAPGRRRATDSTAATRPPP